MDLDRIPGFRPAGASNFAVHNTVANQTCNKGTWFTKSCHTLILLYKPRQQSVIWNSYP